MDISTDNQYYSIEAIANLRLIYESADEDTRQSAIDSIVHSKEKDKARLLIEVFQYIAWRETQGSLLRAIGETKEYRGVEFLIRFIRTTDDLPLASQAALGLGHSQSSLAGEFLLSLLKLKGHRLRQEAIIGLALMPHFYCDDQLVQMIQDENSSDTLRLYAILAAGRRGSKEALPAILNILQKEQGKLYNASMLAAGHLANESDLEDACNRDTSYHLFADELKLYALDRCQIRKQHRIEDLVIGVIEDLSLDWSTSFRLLREFPKEQVWRTIQVLGDKLDIRSECLLRSTTHTHERANEDIDFLISHQDSIDEAEAAILARFCFASQDDKFITRLNPLNACKLLEQVYDSTILEHSDNFYLSSENTPLTIAFINAIVAQSQMTFGTNLGLAEFLLEKLETEEDSSIIERIMRGLAQIGCTEKAYLEKLEQTLEKAENTASMYYSLSLLPTKKSAPIILERLKKLLEQGELSESEEDKREEEIATILKRLSAMGSFGSAEELSTLPIKYHHLNASDLLKILTYNFIKGFDKIITLKLNSDSFIEQLLALGATALNGDHAHCSLLYRYLSFKSQPLRERAIHAICKRGNAEQHLKLLQWFEKDYFTTDIALKIFNTLTPCIDDNYTSVAKFLERLIQEKKGPFVDDEIIAQAFSLHDTLSIFSNQEDLDTDQIPMDRHEQDNFLAKELSGYSNYPENIKVILRNAELTWQHTELFNNLVDKSTMLIQFSKSTDLFMQQRLGNRLFQNPPEDFLPRIQGRIMELGLDNASFSQAKLITFLKLEGFFTAREFPALKLKNLTRSIMSGKIMNDRFRAIDGLRAWSLMLLLFGRTFQFKDSIMTPIIPVRSSDEEKINGIVKLMNKFQDLRNSAAHHGILVEPKLLEEIRSDSFLLLNELEDVLEYGPVDEA